MQRGFLLILGCLFSCAFFAQEKYVMIVNYNNGNQQVITVDDVKDIDFVQDVESPDNIAPADITRGLELYYTFDNGAPTDQQNNFPAFENGGTYIYDTPSGDGKALLLRKGQYLSIGAAPLDNKSNYTLSFWMKDFGASCVVKTKKASYVTSPTVCVTEDMRLLYYTGQNNYDTAKKTFSADMSSYQSGQWVMITIVTEFVKSNQVSNTLYINGRRADAGTSYLSNASGGTAMEIGGAKVDGQESAPMKIDNLRIYSTALSDDEVNELYTRETMPSRIVVAPQELYFDKETEKLTMTLTNSTTSLKDFTITEDVGILNVKPTKGYVPAQGTQTIDVQVYDRDDVSDFQRGALSLSIDGTYYQLPVTIERGKQAPARKIVVSRGMMAYYTMDDLTVKDQYTYGYDGTLSEGSFTDDTPNGTGEALLLSKGNSVSIAAAPYDTKTSYSVSLWVKDFGAGCFLKAKKSNYLTNPSLFVTEDLKLRYYTGQSNYDTAVKTFSADMSRYQSGQWTMITIVTEPTGSNNQVLSTLYINGQRADAGTSYISSANGGISMEFGGANYKGTSSDPMLLDNIRFYGVALTDDEVAEIYAAERK